VSVSSATPPDEEEHLPRQLAHPSAHERLQHREVGAQPARELAGAPVGEEAGREPHEVREHVLAQPRHHALGGGAEQVDLHEVHHALQREEPDEQERDAVEQRAVAVLERGVEHAPDDLREGEPHPRGHHEAHRRDREPAREGAEERRELREHLRGLRAAGGRVACGGGWLGHRYLKLNGVRRAARAGGDRARHARRRRGRH
jgi:hypothetical protein